VRDIHPNVVRDIPGGFYIFVTGKTRCNRKLIIFSCRDVPVEVYRLIEASLRPCFLFDVPFESFKKYNVIHFYQQKFLIHNFETKTRIYSKIHKAVVICLLQTFYTGRKRAHLSFGHFNL